MAFRAAGRLVRGALIVVGGATVGAGLLGYATLSSRESFRVREPSDLYAHVPIL